MSKFLLPVIIFIYILMLFLRFPQTFSYQFNQNLVDRYFLIPIVYLIYLGIQAPFERYYIIVLPFLYLGLANFIIKDFYAKGHRLHQSINKRSK